MDTIIINICILINIYSIYLLFKEVTCVKAELMKITSHMETKVEPIKFSDMKVTNTGREVAKTKCEVATNKCDDEISIEGNV